MTRCPRCGGADGAHYVACVLQNAIQRWLGADYPLYGPAAEPDEERLRTIERSIDAVAEFASEADLGERIAIEVAAQFGPFREQLIDAVGGAIAEYTGPIRHDLDALTDAITRPQSDQYMGRVHEPTNAPKPDAVVEREQSGEPPTPEPPPNDRPANRQGRSAEAMQAVRAKSVEAATNRGLPVMKQVIEQLTRPDPDGWIPGPDLLAAAQEIDPTISAREAGMALTRLGYPKQQRPWGGVGKPAHYRGLAWKDNDPWKPERPLDEQMEQRRAAEAAAKAEMPPEPPPKERYRYTGPKPGPELTPELRKLIEPLWEVPGWSYAPRNPNGGGKPRVISPDGTGYILPNTPSDVKGIRNTRAALRRMGAEI